MSHESQTNSPSRREFLKTSATTVAAAGLLSSQQEVVRAAHSSVRGVLKVGLVGCGGRGTGAAAQALRADKETRLVAMADVFADRLESSLGHLKQTRVADRVSVNPDQRFVGFDAYQKLLATDVDIVLLATPPHFRPQHLKACVEAGKHVFAEKPVAVDAPGVRSVLETTEAARRKNLALVSGLCWRYHFGARAAVNQIQDGKVGRVVSLQSMYNANRPGKPWPMIRETGWKDMEWQLRNWYWFTWLSGDHIVEQAIHSIDKAAWIMHDEPPVSAVGLGGLQTRTGPDRAQIFDHHAVLYEYANGVRHYHYCRQQPGCTNEVSTVALGSKGTCHVEKHRVYDTAGETTWRFRGKRNVMHQTEHDEMYAALRKGEIINNGLYMCRSTMLAIMGRMATYTGKKITWDQALGSRENFTLKQYNWEEKLTVPPVAMPGITPFV